MTTTRDSVADDLSSFGRERSHTKTSHTSCESCSVDHFDHPDDGAFGGKRITFLGSCCLNLNNAMGPAMVLLPLLNQQAGWFTPTLLMFIMFVLSSYSATMLCDAMQRIPGNFTFGHRFEFATIVQHFYGRKWYIAFQVVYNLSLQASNIAAMVISAQVVDTFIQHVAGHTYAFDYQHGRFIKSTGDNNAPWCGVALQDAVCHDDLVFIISLGFIVCMAICIPLGFVNLEDNMWFQWASMAGLFLFTFEFLVQFGFNWSREDKLCLNASNYAVNASCEYIPGNAVGNFSHNGPGRTPAFNSNWQGQAAVLGIAVFNNAYTVTIPSWVNEKKLGVSINKAVWYPAVVAFSMRLFVGLFGGWAFALMLPDGSVRPQADDILSILTLKTNWPVTIYSAYLWDIFTLIPGIPVLAIVVRYNLLSGGVFGKLGSFFWGVVFPWIVTMFMYQQDALSTFCNWVAIVVAGYVNFVVPCILYRKALEMYPDSDFVNESNVQSDESGPLLVKKSGREETVELFSAEAPVQALPTEVVAFGRVFRVSRIGVATFLIWFFTAASTLAVTLSVASAVVSGI